MSLDFKKPIDLFNMAMKTDSEELLRLIEICVKLFEKEKRGTGSLQISGRLVELPLVGEAIIIGDIHGDLESLKHILEDSNFLEKAKSGEEVLLVFLGDYGDRGICSPEVYYVVLKLKQLFPKRVVLMRGNHEGPDDLLAYPHDLPLQINRKFGENGPKVYLELRKLFQHLYSTVLIEKRYVLCHGGVPSQASKIEDFAYAHKKHPHEPHLEEILWSDPWEGIKETYASPRGAGKLFGEDVTNRLLKMLGVRALIRGHEPSNEGFKTNHGGNVLTLFSRRGPPYNNEYGAYLKLNILKEVRITKQVLKGIHKF
ncbi:MAG: serine/threonine protein phosphatase [Candidatus Bathyarchaeota archaeon]|nr:MAG: serine/threonine protein phosphatase [Candidatus Bathyarchaeota archaeon]